MERNKLAYIRKMIFEHNSLNAEIVAWRGQEKEEIKKQVDILTAAVNFFPGIARPLKGFSCYHRSCIRTIKASALTNPLGDAC